MKLIHKFTSIFFASMVFFMSGCSSLPPQPTVLISPSKYVEEEARVGLVYSVVDQPRTYLVGAGCLLCLAAAEIANSSLSNHTKTLSVDEINPIKNEILEVLRSEGVDISEVKLTVPIDKLNKYKTKELGYAKRDFSSLIGKMNVDKIMMLNITGVGFYRPYTNYIPKGAPTAYLEAEVFTVNLSDNKYDLYKKIVYKRPSEGEWNESPDFPGLTNSYYHVIEEFKSDVLNLVLGKE